MEQIYHTTDLIGLKDKNIKICFVLKHQTHIEIRAKLDVLPAACQNCEGRQIKYDFQRVFKTFLSYRKYILNAMTYHYSNAKLEATNNLIKDIKRQAFGFRKMKTLKLRFSSL